MWAQDVSAGKKSAKRIMRLKSSMEVMSAHFWLEKGDHR
jgi:hypothetical protein